jgi:hypothetical protein
MSVTADRPTGTRRLTGHHVDHRLLAGQIQDIQIPSKFIPFNEMNVMQRFALLIVFFAFFLLFANSAHAGLRWQTGFIDKPYRLDTSSLKIGADGTNYIAFGGDDLMLAQKSPGGQWLITTIDSDRSAAVGSNPSLALDGNGYPHVSYQDFTNGDLKYAAFNGTSWSIEIVDANNPTGNELTAYSSLALDSGNNPSISYWGDSKIKYAVFNGSSWNITKIYDTGTTAAANSLALDSAGNPHISYYESIIKDLGYAHHNGTSWSNQFIDSGGDVGQYNSLALDSSGNPRISYYDATNTDLKYAVWSGSSWNVSTLISSANNIGTRSSLALTSNDKYVISYYDQTNENLWAISEGSLFALLINTGTSGLTSLALDNTGKMRVSYTQQGELKLSTYNAGFTHETIARSSSPYITPGALALKSDGNPGVVYYDQPSYAIKYASYNGSSWDIQTVEADNAFQFAEPSLAYDSSDKPFISYGDLTSSTLKVANWTGTTWNITVADASGNVSSRSSITIDSNDFPHVSYSEYVDASTRKLKYAHWTGSAWAAEALTQTGRIGTIISLALTSTDNPVVSFCDMDDYNFKIASKSGAVWSFDSVHSAGANHNNSLAIDRNNTLHFSFIDSAGHLIYAFKNGSSWTFQTVDASSCGGLSLALDKTGKPGISYFDGVTDSLQYAYFTGNSWASKTLEHQAPLVSGGAPFYSSAAIDDTGRIFIAYHTSLKSDLKFAFGTNAFPWTSILPAILHGTP